MYRARIPSVETEGGLANAGNPGLQQARDSFVLIAQLHRCSRRSKIGSTWSSYIFEPDSGTLAAKVTEYLEAVEMRLRETEKQRAAEAIRAEGSRKRDRVTLALSATVLLTLACGRAPRKHHYGKET